MRICFAALAAGLVLLASPGLSTAARLDEALQSPYQVEQTCTPGELHLAPACAFLSWLSGARACFPATKNITGTSSGGRFFRVGAQVGASESSVSLERRARLWSALARARRVR